MDYPQVWATNEPEQRLLIVFGRSGVDPDCLVARLEGKNDPLWIVDDGSGKDRDCYVCGLKGDVRASRLHTFSEVHSR